MDPVQRALGDSTDLYDVATWSVRSRLDRVSVRVYWGLHRAVWWVAILLAVLLLVVQVALTGYAILYQPTLGVLTLLSAIPALALAGFVWYEDVTLRAPLKPVVVTFLLGVLFAGFAAVVNTVFQVAFDLVPVVGSLLFFLLVVGPVEETVKWLAVRSYAYRTDWFASVIDGAVYGAVAGLGFATIENSLYITRGFLSAAQMTGVDPIQSALGTATARAFVGPGHVIYSAFAGYYLGLAKFNHDSYGPIVVKGLLIAAFIHGAYDVLVNYLPLPGLSFVAFVVVYDGFFAYLLYRKLSRYRSAYRTAMEDGADGPGGDSGGNGAQASQEVATGPDESAVTGEATRSSSTEDGTASVDADVETSDG